MCGLYASAQRLGFGTAICWVSTICSVSDARVDTVSAHATVSNHDVRCQYWSTGHHPFHLIPFPVPFLAFALSVCACWSASLVPPDSLGVVVAARALDSTSRRTRDVNRVWDLSCAPHHHSSNQERPTHASQFSGFNFLLWCCRVAHRQVSIGH